MAGHNGTLTRGSASFTGAAAKFGSAGRASGVYTLAGNPDDGHIGPSSTGTVEFFAKIATNPGAIKVAIAGKGNVWWIGNDASGNLMAVCGTEAVTLNGGAICDNAWHHIAFVCAAGVLSLYLDG